MRVAIFDFDGTLYAEETFNLLMDHLKTHPVHSSRYKRFYRGIMPPYIGYKLKLVPEARMKEQSMQAYLSAFNKLTQAEMNTYFNEIAQKMKQNFNPDVVRRMKEHAAEGDYVMLVSGAFTPLLEAVTADLPIDEIIGTDVAYANEALDGKARIRHIQAARKIEAVQAALQDRTVDWQKSVAYSDSFSDLPILQFAGTAIAVRPDDRLRKVAQEQEWEIL